MALKLAIESKVQARAGYYHRFVCFLLLAGCGNIGPLEYALNENISTGVELGFVGVPFGDSQGFQITEVKSGRGLSKLLNLQVGDRISHFRVRPGAIRWRESSDSVDPVFDLGSVSAVYAPSVQNLSQVWKHGHNSFEFFIRRRHGRFVRITGIVNVSKTWEFRRLLGIHHAVWFDPSVKFMFKAQPGIEGLTVDKASTTDKAPRPYADAWCLQPGDRIVSFNGRPVAAESDIVLELERGRSDIGSKRERGRLKGGKPRYTRRQFTDFTLGLVRSGKPLTIREKLRLSYSRVLSARPDLSARITVVLVNRTVVANNALVLHGAGRGHCPKDMD